MQEAIALVERVRSDVVPTDSMKRGFAEQHQWLFTHAIDLLHRLGRDREALAAAEQGRARAFADLLASRDFSPGSTTRADASADKAGRAGDAAVVAEVLRSRGGETPPSAIGLRPDRDLRSLASATPLSSDELVGLTARLQSTLVSYWVAPDATYVWVVRPSGEITGQRIAVTERRLTALVRQTWMTGDAGVTRRGASDQVATSSLQTTRTTSRQRKRTWTPRVRGEGLLSFGERRVVASRELHGSSSRRFSACFHRKRKPADDSSPRRLVLTLVCGTAGPERDVSRRTACDPLRACWGRAAISRSSTRARRMPSDPRYLLVADPQSIPQLPGGKALPRLPGTRPGESRGRGARAGVGGDITRRRERHRASGAFACRRSQRAALRDARGDSRRRSTRVVPRARHRAHRHQSGCPAIWFV